jgi:hypothetical protein
VAQLLLVEKSDFFFSTDLPVPDVAHHAGVIEWAKANVTGIEVLSSATIIGVVMSSK